MFINTNLTILFMFETHIAPQKNYQHKYMFSDTSKCFIKSVLQKTKTLRALLFFQFLSL